MDGLATGAPGLKMKTILIVEDNADSRDLLEQTLPFKPTSSLDYS